ncbi:hypothetical protein AAFN60_06510 [Roseibacillus persicicus]|uniref:hypothetical protein n=1 Tax=Roseibacillus persicicus TaxID=454148 RepID=UPI00398AC417
MKTILSIFILAQFAPAAPQLWCLELPEKHGDYFLEKFRTLDLASLKSINSRLQSLVDDEAIKEIERIDFGKEGSKHPFREPVDQFAFSTYQSRVDRQSLFRDFSIKRPPPEKSLSVSLSGKLGKLWTPSAYFVEEGRRVIVLERDPASPNSLPDVVFESRFEVSNPLSATYIWWSGGHPWTLRNQYPTPENFFFFFMNKSEFKDPQKVTHSLGASLGFVPTQENAWDSHFNLDIPEERGKELIVSEYHTIEEQGLFSGKEHDSRFLFAKVSYDLETRAFVESTTARRKAGGSWSAFMSELPLVPPAR